jgi:hypothetical protein
MILDSQSVRITLDAPGGVMLEHATGSPKKFTAAVSRAPVDAMLTVWLSFLVFAGRDWSHLFPACESLARC